jgi:hypothetical protein
MAAANQTSSRSSESLVGEAMAHPRRRRIPSALRMQCSVIFDQGGFA